MTKYNYKGTTDDLQRKMPHYGDVYYFDNNNNKSLYDEFYIASQRVLSEELIGVKSTPRYFYFTNSNEFNAFASSENVIGVNMGLIENAIHYFLSKNIYLENEDLAEYKILNESLKIVHEIPLNHLMFQFFTQFIFFHEAGHLLQFSNLDKNSGQRFYEKRIISDSRYDLISTLMEFDADLVALNATFTTIKNFYKKIEKKHQSEEMLFKLLSVCTSAMFFFFILLGTHEKQLYLKKFDHPHPLIRIFFMVVALVQLFENDFGTKVAYKGSEITKEAIKITNMILGANIEPFYLATFNQNISEIKQYIAEIYSEIPKHSFLVINTHGKK